MHEFLLIIAESAQSRSIRLRTNQRRDLARMYCTARSVVLHN